MATLAIDTLRYAKRLQAAGVPQEQAEAQAEALSEAIRDSLVTKQDLHDGFEAFRTEMRQEFAAVRLEMRDLHNGLIRWLIPLMLGQTAAVVALVKLL